MTRPLRVGDRVSATGTVTRVNETLNYVTVLFRGAPSSVAFAPATVTLIAPAEPPVGSVVVKDGVAWTRQKTHPNHSQWYSGGILEHATWDDLSDSEIIFTPGGDA